MAWLSQSLLVAACAGSVSLVFRYRRKWATKKFLREMPKVELHVHLDGSFDEERLFHWARLRSDVLPASVKCFWDGTEIRVKEAVDRASRSDFHKLVTSKGSRSLFEVFKAFEVYKPIVNGDEEVLEDLAFHFCKRQKNSNVIYTEVRYSPHLLVDKEKSDMSAEDVILAVTRGLRRGEDTFGILVRQILCCICHCPTFAEEVIELAHKLRDEGIVGVDIAAGEAHFKHEEPNLRQPHVLAMQRAKELGLNITIHAGEEGPASNVIDAVKTYHAQRIGHGYHLLDDPVMYRSIIEGRIHFEGCPTSSYETGGFAGEDWLKHPLKQFQADGANLSINTDDPSVFATCLEEEMLICINKMGLTLRDMATCTLNAARAAFAPEDEKRLLESKIVQYFIAKVPS